jgi:hypothetical protein
MGLGCDGITDVQITNLGYPGAGSGQDGQIPARKWCGTFLDSSGWGEGNQLGLVWLRSQVRIWGWVQFCVIIK